MKQKMRALQKIYFWVGTEPPKTDKTVVHIYLSTLGIQKPHCIFKPLLGEVVYFLKFQILMEEHAPQNGWFFIHFVMFASTLVVV